MVEEVDLEQITRRAPLLWLFMGLLVVLVCVLAVLQYNWIGEISVNEQKRLQDDLQGQLNKLAGDFDSEVGTAIRALLPEEPQVQEIGRDQAYQLRYAGWRASTPHLRLFRRIAVAYLENGRPQLEMFNAQTGALEKSEWPPEWTPVRDSFNPRPDNRNDGRNGGRNGPPPRIDNSTLIDVPRFRGRPPDGPGPPGDQDWLLLDIDRSYAGSAILPELLSERFTEDFRASYRVEVTSRANPSELIYASDTGPSPADPAQATVLILDPLRANQIGFGRGPGGRGPPPPGGPPPGGPPPGGPPKGKGGDFGRGRWQLSLWLRNGTLESAVASVRHRNLAVSAGILLLLLATGAALAQFSRRAQRLAQVEMDFIAGISHELRTPLTVIRTAAFNLRGKMASNPSQVERYGALIQQESERLGDIVEQVLRFASVKAGRAVQDHQPVSVSGLIEETVEANKGMLEDMFCEVQTQVQAGMPPIAGDSLALRQALQNLLANAAKYGAAGNQPVEISARAVSGAKGPEIEIRVTDHGPGIPVDEQKHVFDAFYRGRKAVQDQIHGTGLGLHLVKKIVEAHGGTVSLESVPGLGATFIVRLPAAPAEHNDELAHSLG